MSLTQMILDIDIEADNAEITVVESLIESYDKSVMILEGCSDGCDVSAFDIFQEGEKWDKFKDDANQKITGVEGESLGKRIAMFIPRLIAALIRLCKKIFSRNKKITEKMKQDVAEMKAEVNNPTPQPASDVSETPKKPEEKPESPTETKEPEKKPANDTDAEIESLSRDLKMKNLKPKQSGGYKIIESILFSQNGSDDFEQGFADPKWFENADAELMRTLEAVKSGNNINDQLNVIKKYIKEFAPIRSKLDGLTARGGTAIQIKDSEFVSKMEHFAKQSEGSINACNALVQDLRAKLEEINKVEFSDDVKPALNQLLRKLNTLINSLDGYSVMIYQAWEHDRGARNNVRFVSA